MNQETSEAQAQHAESMREKALWQEYSSRKSQLRGLTSEQYDEAIKQIVKELGI